ncbi:MAG: glycosyltransferase family 4 protein [candidate division KSB1 bacterium]|nr:glycosyltransferase family 4 protein [candidate division KSB1 bacterium]
MKIIIHDYCGHPFPFDLSRELAKRGHRVWHVYTSASGGPKAGLVSDNENLTVVNIEHDPVQKMNFVKRWFQEHEYGVKISAEITKLKPDVVLSSNTPLEAQRLLLKTCNKLKIPMIHWLQDIISVAARRLLKKRMGFLGRAIGWHFDKLERNILQTCSHIISIAPEFRRQLDAWNISEDKVTVIPNWAPIRDIPVMPKKNDWSKDLKIDNKFVVLYSGTLGMKHNPDVIVDAAVSLKSSKDICFVVVSEGQGMDYLKQEKGNKELSNLLLLPLQPFDKFPQVLAAADLLLVLLEEDAGIFSVPSKVWSGYCAQRPSLLVVPPENLSAKITRRIKAGKVIALEEKQQLPDIILDLKNVPDARSVWGENARRYAEKHFQIATIADKFENILKSEANI